MNPTAHTPHTRSRLWLLPVLALALILAAPACKKGPGKNAADKAAAARKTPPPKDAVVTMKKTGESITLTEINKAFEMELPDQSKFALKNNTENWQQQFLNRWIDMTVLAEMARKKDMDKSEEYKTMQKVKETSILAGLYYSKYILPELEKIKVEDADIDKYYDENKNEMFFVGRRQVRHIVVDSELQAKDLYNQLKADAAGFADAARKHSTDKGTAKDGGMLGWITRGDERVPAEVENTYLFTPRGQVSQPVQSRTGWRLVYMEDASPQDMDFMPLDASLRERIRQLVTVSKMEESYDRILAKFKNELDIKVDNAMVPEIASDWARSVEQNMPDMNRPPMQ